MRRLHPLRRLINDLWVLVVSQPALVAQLPPETVKLAEINAFCVNDEEITEPDSILVDSQAMDALWVICWHGGTCRLNIVGTHDTREQVTVGDHVLEGSWSTIAPRLIEWAGLLAQRKANDPIPGPPGAGR